MKKQLEAEKTKQILNRRRKVGERGSVTLFVLIAMIFFLTVGIAVLISSMNSNISQKRDVKKIQNEYSNLGDSEQIYEEQKEKVSRKSYYHS